MNIVSLGHNCSIAAELKRLGVWNNKYAFDTMNSVCLEKVCDLLLGGEDWFKDYSIDSKPTRSKDWRIDCLRYKTISVHDVSFDLNKQEVITNLIDKKQKDLQELKNVIKNNREHIILIRSNIKDTKKEEIVYLYETIIKLRGTNFSLYVFQNKDYSFDLKGLNYFKMKPPSWSNYEEIWQRDDNWFRAIKSIVFNVEEKVKFL